VRQPWRLAAAYLDAVYGDDLPDLAVTGRHRDGWPAVVAMARSATNAPRTSSVGRLFDAVAAILGLRDAVTYEGQAAIELEQRVDPDERAAYPVPLDESAPLSGTGPALIEAVVEDLTHGVHIGRIAARFHNGVAAVIERACVALRDRHGPGVVALSGGVFQNVLLLRLVVGELEAAGLRALTHSRVPPNDAGISLGQVAVAAARDAR